MYKKGRKNMKIKELKIVDGMVEKIENRLKEITDNEYHADTFVVVDGINLTNWADGFQVELIIRWGFDTADGRAGKNETYSIDVGDGNLEFVAGQFYQAIIDAEKIDRRNSKETTCFFHKDMI